MSEFDHILIVANPSSGKGHSGKRLHAAERELQALGAPVESTITAVPGDGSRLAAEVQGERPLVVVFGGDGTFNEVLNGADLGRAVLGFIPGGTGNVIGKELGLSLRARRAARQLAGGHVRTFDIGRCNDRLFACMFGAGLDGRIVKLVAEGRGARMTKLRYIPYMKRALLHIPDWGIRVRVDGRELADGLRQVIIANTRSYGGPFEPASAALPDDGLLDAVGLHLGGPLRSLGALISTFLGRLHCTESVPYERGTEFVVESELPDCPVQVDGEALGVLPATISVLPEAMRVLVPAGYTPPKPKTIAR